MNIPNTAGVVLVATLGQYAAMVYSVRVMALVALAVAEKLAIAEVACATLSSR
jgi:hypothetical protein